MATAPEDGQLIALLLKLTNAKKTIEIGVFTEYSLVLNALTIPDNGKIIAIDLYRDAYEMESPIIKKANVEHKINFIQSSALSALDELLNEYHERMLELVKVGGIIVYDNTLWFETVAMPEEYVKETMKPNRQHIIEFNKFLDSDTRVQISQVPTGDGITICWRL
uniref:caffeoyl-CoA O-methyltransferase n=1 Tax=Solanum lycopersicum TaxID=4081 RepID=K4C0H6_SOLLC